jgi:hypothetical protein
LPVDSEEGLIALIIKSAATIRHQPGIFECKHQSLLHHHQLFISVGGHMFEHLL